MTLGGISLSFLCVCGILFPRPGSQTVPPAVGARSLNHWPASEVPGRDNSGAQVPPCSNDGAPVVFLKGSGDQQAHHGDQGGGNVPHFIYSLDKFSANSRQCWFLELQSGGPPQGENDPPRFLPRANSLAPWISICSYRGIKNGSVRGFPGGAVVENLPANAGHTGSSPGPGGSHMPRSN